MHKPASLSLSSHSNSGLIVMVAVMAKVTDTPVWGRGGNQRLCFLSEVTVLGSDPLLAFGLLSPVCGDVSGKFY